MTVALMFTTIFSATILVKAAGFSPRYSAPSYDNSYYYSSQNPFYAAGYGMPNCTCYAYGRAYEILGYAPSLSTGNAENWYGYNKNGGYYNYGSTPKVGAIACWSYNGGGGHVAVVESIDNGIITLSNSAWSGTNFYISTASVDDPLVGGNSWWNFQGYIYILDNGSDDPVKPTEPKSTDGYSTGIYQVNVGNSLNMRIGAGIEYGIIGSIPNGAKINVTDISSDSSYVWGYTTYNGVSGWTALEYCRYIGSDDPQPEPQTEPQPEPQPEPETQPEPEETPVVPDDKADDSSVSSDSEQSDVSANDETKEPEQTHDYVLYISNQNSEETVAYPLSSSDQTADVSLSAGNYNVYMQEDGVTVSSTYELVVDAKSDVSITYDIDKDYFLIVCNPTDEEPQVMSINETESVTEDETVSEPASEPATDVVATSSVATADTPKVSTSDTADSDNGAIKTGQDVQAIAVIVLALSIGALSFMFVNRRKFFK